MIGPRMLRRRQRQSEASDRCFSPVGIVPQSNCHNRIDPRLYLSGKSQCEEGIATIAERNAPARLWIMVDRSHCRIFYRLAEPIGRRKHDLGFFSIWRYFDLNLRQDKPV